jgi:hypothetical protein
LEIKILRKILNFASFEAQKFSPSFCFKAKIIKSKQSEIFKEKKAKKSKKTKKKKKSEKSEKNEKIDLNIASLYFASKQKLLK